MTRLRSRGHLALTSDALALGRRRVAPVVAAGLTLLLLAGCAGASSSESSSAADGGARAAAPFSATDQSGDVTSSDQKVQAGSEGPAPLAQRRQVRTGSLTVGVRQVADAVTSVRQIVTAAKGFVADEQTTTRVGHPDGPASSGPGRRPEPIASPGTVPPVTGMDRSVVVDRSVLTLRVPQQSLDRVMDDIAAIGTMRARSQSSQDVTDVYVDTQSRLRTQRESVARVRALLSKADTIGDVVKVEGELTRRQADLESLEARLASLDDSTTLATLTVDLAPTTPPAAAADLQRQGFVGGLRGGWHALATAAVIGSRVAGAVLPFAVLIAIIAVPVRLAVRRRRRSPVPSA